MKEVYFDNAATTRVRPEAAELSLKIMEEDYGNPSSMHFYGYKAERYILEAKNIVAKTLRVSPAEIIFNSGGTEGNNTALRGIALKMKAYGKHIITSNIEHASVYNPLMQLEKEGFEVTYLPVDSNGRLNADTVAEAVRDDTILVSIMWVNNEIGSVFNIPAIARKIKRKNPSLLVHTDAVQAYGKLDLRPREAMVDMLSVSGHKIHAPKGVGFMYIKGGTRLAPLILGGGQQKDMRSGTENVPGIASLGLSARMYYKEREEIVNRIANIRERMRVRLSQMKDVTVNSGIGSGWAQHILSASFWGVKSEVFLNALSNRGVYVSAGSACSSNHPAISGTLKAIGLSKGLLESTLRFSFGIYNTPDEADYVCNMIESLLPELRKFTRW